MDDWERRLGELESDLRAWRGRFDAAYDAVVRERRLRRWLRRPRPEELSAAAEEARRRAGTEVLTELSALFDEIVDLYPGSLPQDRARIRARVGAAEQAFELFWGYVEECPGRIRGDRAEAELRRGLVAVAIDDMRAEIGLVDGVVARLILAAARAGVPWRPVLQDVASVANPGAGGGGACMRHHLLGFERSAAYRDLVEPGLREAGRQARTSAAAS